MLEMMVLSWPPLEAAMKAEYISAQDHAEQRRALEAKVEEAQATLERGAQGLGCSACFINRTAVEVAC